MGLAGMGSSITFTLAHWMFAERYWILSYKIPSMIDQTIQGPDLTTPKRTNTLMISLTILIAMASTSVYYGLVFGNVKQTTLNTVFLYFLIMSSAILDLVSCVVLYLAFRTIGSATKDSYDLNIKSGMMYVHLAAYVLCVISLFLFIL